MHFYLIITRCLFYVSVASHVIDDFLTGSRITQLIEIKTQSLLRVVISSRKLSSKKLFLEITATLVVS